MEPLEGREESSRGDARGEQSCNSSLVQAHRTRQMGLNSGRQRQHPATAQHDGNSMTMAAQQEIAMPAKIADAVLAVVS